jgi:hypothetical protein
LQELVAAAASRERSLDSAVKTYGEGERAHRTTYDSLKHSVLGSTKRELYERARKAGVAGRSKMSKKELARAVARKQA